MKAYTYLFNSSPGVVECERLDGKTIRVVLPGANQVRGMSMKDSILQSAKHELEIDERVRQTLVIFDGVLLPNGLPRSSKVVSQEERGLIGLDENKLRIRRTSLYEARMDPPYSWCSRSNDKEVVLARIDLVRHFILLPVGKACVQGWQPPAFIPKYRMIVVEPSKVGDGTNVTWLNSDAWSHQAKSKRPARFSSRRPIFLFNFCFLFQPL